MRRSIHLYELRATRTGSLCVRDGAGAPIRRVTSPKDAGAILRAIIGERDREMLVCLYLDSQSAVTGAEVLTVGGLNTTRSHPRDIFRGAILAGAAGIILAHNHPSGTCEPSRDDLEFTHSVRRAGELLGIELYDHLILGDGAHTSLRESGLI